MGLFSKKARPGPQDATQPQKILGFDEMVIMARNAKQKLGTLTVEDIQHTFQIDYSSAARISAAVDGKSSCDPIKKMKIYPSYVGNAKLRFFYLKPIEPLQEGSIAEVLGSEEKIVEINIDGDDVICSYNGKPFASIKNDPKSALMVRDYIKRDDPVLAILLADGKTVNLRFYKDLKKYVGKREKTVTGLAAYKGKSRQEVLSYVSAGDEVELVEEDNAVTVKCGAETIGKLPATLANRYIEEGAFYACIEDIDEEETDDYETVYIPKIAIYW